MVENHLQKRNQNTAAVGSESAYVTARLIYGFLFLPECLKIWSGQSKLGQLSCENQHSGPHLIQRDWSLGDKANSGSWVKGSLAVFTLAETWLFPQRRDRLVKTTTAAAITWSRVCRVISGKGFGEPCADAKTGKLRPVWIQTWQKAAEINPHARLTNERVIIGA